MTYRELPNPFKGMTPEEARAASDKAIREAKEAFRRTARPQPFRPSDVTRVPKPDPCAPGGPVAKIRAELERPWPEGLKARLVTLSAGDVARFGVEAIADVFRGWGWSVKYEPFNDGAPLGSWPAFGFTFTLPDADDE